MAHRRWKASIFLVAKPARPPQVLRPSLARRQAVRIMA
jgi:hypothetical protein